MAIHTKPPAPIEIAPGQPSVFLAGSIGMGHAIDWQAEVAEALRDFDLVLLNPRRAAWDASWPQSADDPRFHEQVDWELSALERADIIATYFAPDTQAPITLLELGLFARSGKMIVCCPDGFWRKGNVDMVCRRYGVPTVASLSELITSVKRALAARA